MVDTDIVDDHEHLLPLHPVKKILQRHCPHDISTEAVVAMRDLMETIAESIAESAVNRFHQLNEHREKQGLRRLKRLNEWAIRTRTSPDYINKEKINDKGSQITRQELGNPGGETVNGTHTAKPGTSAEEQEVD